VKQRETPGWRKIKELLVTRGWSQASGTGWEPASRDRGRARARNQMLEAGPGCTILSSPPPHPPPRSVIEWARLALRVTARCAGSYTG